MGTAFLQCGGDDQARLLQATLLMQYALDLLDQMGESRAATHLQHAIDTLKKQLPNGGQLQ